MPKAKIVKTKKVLKKLDHQPAPQENEDFRLWLGISNVDAVANIGVLPFLLGYFVNVSVFTALFLYLIATVCLAYTIIRYFTTYDSKFSRRNWERNKWITLIASAFVVGLMVASIKTKYEIQYQPVTCTITIQNNCSKTSSVQ